MLDENHSAGFEKVSLANLWLEKRGGDSKTKVIIVDILKRSSKHLLINTTTSRILNCLKKTSVRRLKSYQERSGCAGRPTDLLSNTHLLKWLPMQRPTIRVRTRAIVTL